MSARKRIANKVPSYKLPKTLENQEDQDLKSVKANLLKELEQSKEKLQDWYDKELDKNLKNIKV